MREVPCIHFPHPGGRTALRHGGAAGEAPAGGGRGGLAVSPDLLALREQFPRGSVGTISLDLQVNRSVLTVAGGRREPENSEDASAVTYLHRGIAQRGFKLSFNLADHIEVRSANLSNGLLSIELERVVPEEAKPRRIEIKQGDKPTLLN